MDDMERSINGILNSYTPEFAKKERAILLNKIKNTNKDDEKGQFYADLVKYSLVLGKIQEAQIYARETERLGCEDQGWYWYVDYFKELNLAGIQIKKGYSTFEETLVGYRNIIKLCPVEGLFRLGEFFESKKNISQAIKCFLKAKKASDIQRIRSMIDMRLNKLLTT